MKPSSGCDNIGNVVFSLKFVLTPLKININYNKEGLAQMFFLCKIWVNNSGSRGRLLFPQRPSRDLDQKKWGMKSCQRQETPKWPLNSRCIWHFFRCYLCIIYIYMYISSLWLFAYWHMYLHMCFGNQPKSCRQQYSKRQYCWWFRNPKQPPFGCINKTCKQWDFNYCSLNWAMKTTLVGLML